MHIAKSLLSTLFITCSLLSLTGCSEKKDPNTITVGTITGPETELMEVAKEVAQEKYHLNIKINTFTDYNIPNLALNDGSLDANMFQHVPFLNNQIKNRGYLLVSLGRTFIYPMALYSDRYKNLKDLPNNAMVAIPNDPSNEARALLLIQKAGLITLKPDAGTDATPMDITSNPKQLKWVELDAAQLTRSLKDVDLAAINTNYAIAAGLSPQKNGLFMEDKNSPYANIVVVRAEDQNKLQLKELVMALQSKPVLEKAHQLFKDGAIPAF